MTTPAEVQADFTYQNKLARSLYASRDYPGAQAAFASAQAIAYSTDSPDYFADDLAFTRSILSGDQSAANDASNLDALLKRGEQNARPDSVAGAFFGSLRDQGRAALDKLSLVPWKWIGIGVAALAILNMTGTTSTVIRTVKNPLRLFGLGKKKRRKKKNPA